jgi:endonuclease/exonuclease/phosphatase family metal-dependent hydrolase
MQPTRSAHRSAPAILADPALGGEHEIDGPGRSLRVMTYNARGLRAGVRTVARAVRAAEPEILLLQESGGRLALGRLARSIGMQLANDPFSFPRRRVKNAVLCRSPWELGTQGFRRFSSSARFYPRGVITAEVRSGPVALRCASVHLGLRPAERIRHARELDELLRSDRRGVAEDVVVGGDFNELPDGRAIAFLAGRLADAWAAAGAGGGAEGPGVTFPAQDPTARIDYVFVSGELEIRAARVPADAGTASASDHLPVVVDLAVGSGERARAR